MQHLLIAMICGMAIFWQDIKTRRIHLIPILVLTLDGLFRNGLNIGKNTLISFFINLAFLACMLFTVVFFYRLKGEKQVMDRMLGWGDVLTLVALAAWMEPPTFLFFYTASTLLIGFVFSLLTWIGRVDPAYPIPLAGWLCLLFNMYLSLSYFL
jgi:uncharacterized membrane protein